MAVTSTHVEGDICPHCTNGELQRIEIAEYPGQWLQCNDCQEQYVLELSITPAMNAFLNEYQAAAEREPEADNRTLKTIAGNLAERWSLDLRSVTVLREGFFMDAQGRLRKLSNGANEALRTR